MPERRWGKRFRDHLQIRFGVSDLSGIGFVEDFSLRGLFVNTADIHPPGTALALELAALDGERVRMQGEVRWDKEVIPCLAWKVAAAGMGVLIRRFPAVADEIAYERLCQEHCRRNARRA